MTQTEFIALVRTPEMVGAEHVSDLRQMTEHFPYFAVPHLLLLKALKNSDSIHFSSTLKSTALYASSRKRLYYYLYPEKQKLAVAPKARKTSSSGDYFDMIEHVERQGTDSKQSLKELAERLKSARSMVAVDKVHERPSRPVINLSPVMESPHALDSPISVELTEDEMMEKKAKAYIKAKQYSQAIEILRALNLNNSKKSVYFADQIRFLEKVIANSYK